MGTVDYSFKTLGTKWNERDGWESDLDGRGKEGSRRESLEHTYKLVSGKRSERSGEKRQNEDPGDEELNKMLALSLFIFPLAE